MHHHKPAWQPVWFTSACITLFYLLCTRPLIKTDDGHFWGIANRPGFALLPWLRERYHTLSGRTVGEALLMFFLNQPFWLWQMASAACLCGVLALACHLACPQASPPSLRTHRSRWVCIALGLVLPTCMSTGALWFAGSFTYLWPTAGLLLCIGPTLCATCNRSCPSWLSIVSVFATPLAAASEQTAAATLALLLCQNLWLLAHKQGALRHALPLPGLVLCSWWLFQSPGARLRNVAEATAQFPRFLSMHFLGKLSCGFANYIAYALFFSLPLMALFLLALHRNLREVNALPKKWSQAHLIGSFGFMLGGNAFAWGYGRATPDALWQNAFVSGKIPFLLRIFLGICALWFASVIALCIRLWQKNPSLGFRVGLFCAAAAGSGMAPGFSGSIFASGQRIFFVSELCLVLAIAQLVAGLAPTPAEHRTQKAFALVAVLFFVVHVLGFTALELPLMG